MNILLERYAYLKEGTFGRLTINNKTYYTVECPWDNNKRFVSCLPEAIYELVPHSSTKYYNTFALINQEIGVTHYEEHGCSRYSCLIHAANWPRQVQGCIGTGISAVTINNRMQTLRSREALYEIIDLIEDQVITHIEITHAEAKLKN